jgi:YfiH family protein
MLCVYDLDLMNARSNAADFRARPFPHWSFESAHAAIRFVGRTGEEQEAGRAEVLRRLDGVPPDIAWVDQRHSASVRRARAGSCGEGDALWTQRPGLALSIVTADCVPIICARAGAVAAIHAGWRGLVGGVIEAALADLPDSSRGLEAWLGPAIGPCCYEVGEDVAQLVVASTNPSVRRIDSPGGRPHLDLHGAAEIQLRRLGVERVHRVDACTRCSAGILWSYRGSQGTNGRNLTFAWLAVP